MTFVMGGISHAGSWQVCLLDLEKQEKNLLHQILQLEQVII